MRKWLRRKLHNFMYPAEAAMNKIEVVSASDSGVDMDNSLRFNVLVASGGVVLQIHRYDRKTDRSNNSTHIIPDHENVSEKIGQIVSLEILKG